VDLIGRQSWGGKRTFAAQGRIPSEVPSIVISAVCISAWRRDRVLINSKVKLSKHVAEHLSHGGFRAVDVFVDGGDVVGGGRTEQGETIRRAENRYSLRSLETVRMAVRGRRRPSPRRVRGEACRHVERKKVWLHEEGAE
jgi:hypothetical protein